MKIDEAGSDPLGLEGKDLIHSTMSAAGRRRIDVEEVVGVVPKARVVHVRYKQPCMSEPLERPADQTRKCLELGAAQAGQRLQQVVPPDADHHDGPTWHRSDRDLSFKISRRRAVDGRVDDRDRLVPPSAPEIATAELWKEPVVVAGKERLRCYAALVVVPAIEDRISEREEDGQRSTGYSIVAAWTDVTYGKYCAMRLQLSPSVLLAHTSPLAVPK